MPIQKLKDFLDRHEVPYKSIYHSQTYTAQRTAEATHIKGKEMAKTIVVKVDGRPAMVVIPAHHHLDLEHFRACTGADKVELADEQEFKNLFPECEVGAMPPFGNLYNMDVYVHDDLTRDEEIAFNAGSHTEVIQVAFQDFADLVHPLVGEFSHLD